MPLAVQGEPPARPYICRMAQCMHVERAMMPGMIRFLMAVWLAILSFDGLVAEGFDHGSAVPELRAHCREKYTQRIAILNQIDGLNG